MHLAESDEPGGEHLENIVLNDLIAWRDARIERADIFYWRTQAGEEVDLVIESGGRLIPIEIKSSERPCVADTKNIRTFRAEYGNDARSGILFHTGKQFEWIAPDVLAVPWWMVV
jgi:predicted AAA+ superfamily ATPase